MAMTMKTQSRRLLSNPAARCRLFSSTTACRLSLAFDHHEPPKGGRSRHDEPIVFMHGLFGSKKNNRTVSRVLAKDLGRHVYAIDLRNHGESPHDPKHDYPSMAEDVAGFIGQHGLRNPTLIGHSMGAKAAMTLALDQPNLVKDIVSVDNAPVDAVLGSGFAKYIQGMKRIDDANVTRMADADKILEEYEKDLPVRQFLLGNLHRPQGSNTQKFRVPIGTLGSSLSHLGDFPFRDPDKTRFEKPALFVRGTRSKYVADEALPLIGRFFPRFSLVDIEAGHWVISEKPQEFLQAVLEFLGPKE